MSDEQAPEPRPVGRFMGKVGPEERKVAFEHVAQWGWNSAAVAARIGVSRRYINELLHKDPEFYELIMEARGRFLHRLEKAAVSRAVDGWHEERLGPDGESYLIPRFDGSLLVRLLQKHDPEGYGNKVTVERTTRVEIGLSKLSLESQRQLMEILTREGEPTTDAEFQLLGQDPGQDPVPAPEPAPAEDLPGG